MPFLSLPGLIRYLKRHYEELGDLWNQCQNYAILDKLANMQLRVEALINTLEELEAKKNMYNIR